MTEYGMIFDKASMKNQLENANRDYLGRKTWEDLYASVGLSKAQQLNTLEADYSKAMAEAYSSAYSTGQSILASDIGQGYKTAALDETKLALEQAYNTYRQQYLQNASTVESSASQTASAINEAQTTQADYAAQLANAPYQYLQYLFNTYSEGNDTDNIFYTDPMWKRYTTIDPETGETILRSWEDLVSQSNEYTIENENKIRSDVVGVEKLLNQGLNDITVKENAGLFDSAGNLTSKGKDFYDQMMNSLAYQGKELTFGKWLAENNKELYDWSQSANPYDYSVAGTNLGSFKEMLGLNSYDYNYSFKERFGGMTDKEIENMISPYSSRINELAQKVEKNAGKSGKKLINEYKDLTNEIISLTDALGITSDLEKEMNIKLSDMSEYLTNLATTTKDKPGANEIFNYIFPSIPGYIAIANDAKSRKKANKQNAKLASNAYNTLVDALTQYMQHKLSEK